VSELGLLVAEMHSRDRWNGGLVDAWVREIDRDATEQRGLEQALRGEAALDELIARRVIAECGACGRIGGGADRFCAGCGRELPRNAAQRTETATSDTLVGELTTIGPSA
jgi:hypothetical protein